MTANLTAERLSLLRWRMFRNALFALVPPAAGTGAVLIWVMPGWPMVLLAVAATAASVWLARRRTPSLRGVARLMDRSIVADDELVTAFAAAASPAPMAALVRKSAWVRLSAEAPERLVPFATRACGAAIAAPLALAALVAVAGPPWGSEERPVGPPTGDTAALTAARAADTAVTEPAAPGADAAKSADTSAQPNDPDEPARPGDDATAVTGREERQPQNLVLGTGSALLAAETARTGGEGETAATGGGEESLIAGRGNRGDGDASPRAAGLPERLGTLAAGARPAEAAIDEADYPPGLRGYLRNYFLAIAR